MAMVPVLLWGWIVALLGADSSSEDQDNRMVATAVGEEETDVLNDLLFSF